MAVRLDEWAYTDVGDSFEEIKIRAGYANSIFPISTTWRNAKKSRVPTDLLQLRTFLSSITSANFRYQGRVDTTPARPRDQPRRS